MQLGPESALANAPDGKQYVHVLPGNHFLVKPFLNFSAGIFISPHRVAETEMPQHTARELFHNASNLPVFLKTLQGNDRPTFNRIEKFITEVFPEFQYVNPASLDDNKARITFTLRNTSQQIPLAKCGTGVEQLLSLACFLLTSPEGALVLMDEPHSNLHPLAERQLVDFLKSYPKHTIFASTHSSILINSVEGTRITVLREGVVVDTDSERSAKMASILYDLGYQNSDLLFFDRLIIVEGESDAEILPILLRNSSVFGERDLSATGFPIMGGGGSLKKRGAQERILLYEKLLSAVGNAKQPRIYLFDGDHDKEEQTLVGGMKQTDGKPLTAVFLPVPEIENYLLNAPAIAMAIQEEAAVLGLKVTVSQDAVRARLNELSSPGEQQTVVKGSHALESIYDSFDLVYDKRKSGHLIAKHLPPGDVQLTSLGQQIRKAFS